MFHPAAKAAMLVSLLLSPLEATAADEERPKQILLVSFDGAHDIALWQKSREMASRTGAHFTYFLSCTFLMTQAERHAYQAPHQKPGRSNIGFAQSDDEVRERLGNLWHAHLEGHEIASHACGHFDGRQWSEADWSAEFLTVRRIMRGAWSSVGLEEPKGWQDLVDKGLNGFRAPYLSTDGGQAMVTAERKAGFTFDASLVTKGPQMPVREAGLLRFGLPLIPEGPKRRPIVAMDYNLFVRHSGAKEDATESAAFEARSFAAFRAAFDEQYAGDRIPLQLGFHFVEMNGGAYWRALDRLLTEVCRLPDVACLSYSEAIPMIEARIAPEKKPGL